jgi:hypothetical protein
MVWFTSVLFDKLKRIFMLRCFPPNNDNYVAQDIFDEGDRQILPRHEKWFSAYDFVFSVIMIPYGSITAIQKLEYLFLCAMGHMARGDKTIFPIGAEWCDTPFQALTAIMLRDERLTSPIVNIFVDRKETDFGLGLLDLRGRLRGCARGIGSGSPQLKAFRVRKSGVVGSM